jgi:AAA+ ATPase superfamily predicted ATPase
VFQAQALEVQQKLEATQQNLFSKVEIIQNYFREVNQSLENIDFREREATAARITFQKAVVSSSKEEISVTPRTPRLTVEEKIRGDIILKTWEANIAESKRAAKEIKEDCEEMFYLLNKESLSLGNDDCSEVLGQINIVKHQLDIKEGLETAQAEISQLNQVDIAQIDRWLVKPNLQLQLIIS